MTKSNGTEIVQEKGRITARQLAFLVVTLVIATGDVSLPLFVAQEAKQDSWLSVIAGTAFCMAATLLLLALGLKYPGKTIIQYSCDILGKPLGKLVGFLYIQYLFHMSAGVTREVDEIFVTAFNPEAPLAVFSIVTLAVALFAVWKGIEVITRVNELLLPLGIVILLLIAIFNIPNMDFNNFRPVLAEGIVPVLRGALVIQGWMLEIVLILQLIPFVKDRDRIKKNVLLSVLVLGISMELGALAIAVFGPLTVRLVFPALEYVRYIRLGKYFENLDITIIGVWIAGIFLKAAMSYYAAALALSQLFGIKSYRQIAVPVGLLIIVYSLSVPQRIPGFLNYLHYIYPFFSLFIGFVLPAVLFAVSLFKGRAVFPKNASS